MVGVPHKTANERTTLKSKTLLGLDVRLLKKPLQYVVLQTQMNGSSRNQNRAPSANKYQVPGFNTAERSYHFYFQCFKCKT